MVALSSVVGLTGVVAAGCGAATGLECEHIGARCPDPPPAANKVTCGCDSCVPLADDFVSCTDGSRAGLYELCMPQGMDPETFCRTVAPTMLGAATDFALGLDADTIGCARFQCDVAAGTSAVFNQTCPHHLDVGFPALECVETPCTASSCRLRPDSTADCRCNTLNDCHGTPTTLACTPEIGSGDPPESHTGPMTDFVAAESAITLDPASSSLEIRSCFDVIGITYCASTTAAVRGNVTLYGRPNADGSGDFLLDFGVFVADLALDFGFVVPTGNVVVHVSDIYAVGGSGPHPIHVDAAGNGAMPRGTMILTVHAVQDGTEILAVDAPVSRDTTIEIDFAHRTFRVPRLGFALEGVTGEITLTGTITNQPPIASAGADQRVECNAPGGATITLDATATTDPDADLRQYEWLLGPAFDASSPTLGIAPTIQILQPVGAADYSLVVSDDRLQVDVDEVHVEVTDTTPPTLTASAEPACLFPPNHSVVLYALGGGIEPSVADVCDATPADVRIVDVHSSQPVTGGGSGATDPDIVFGPHALCVRAERAGTDATGREYTVTLEATDGHGNASRTAVTIEVPHDQVGGVHCGPPAADRIVSIDDPRCQE